MTGFPFEKQQKKKSMNPSQLRRSQARIKKFIEKKEMVKQNASSDLVTQSDESSDCRNSQEVQLVLELKAVAGVQQQHEGGAEIPQLDGEAEVHVNIPEEVVKHVYQFDHQKGRGDRETLVNIMRETMLEEIVKDILVNHIEDKSSSFGKKYNVFRTTLTIIRGK